ncbi:MAG: DUF5663 domain-containing protein, partial [Candidatus Saccharimonadales bacterium]
INKNDQKGALTWLEGNFPNYKDVVAEELNKLKKEIKESAPKILEEVSKATTGSTEDNKKSDGKTE